jgi:SCY1-like protein 2
MLAAASSFFGRSAISQSYNIGSASSGSRTSTPSVASSSTSSPPVAFTPSVNVGPWKVQSAYHKVTNKRASVWSLDKKHPEIDRLSAVAKEGALDVLKTEVTFSDRHRCNYLLALSRIIYKGVCIGTTAPSVHLGYVCVRLYSLITVF